jgi:predicted ATPase/DNA-binding SARP family transcriptional activator
VEFGILGPLEVRSEGEVVAIPGSKQRQLLAILLLHANKVVGSERLIEALWSQRPPGSGVNALQVRVSQLRKALGPGGSALETKPSGYLLRLQPGQLDVDRFEQLVAAAETADAGEAAAKLHEALALWRGPPLADFSYEEFAQSPIGRLEELRLTALERRIDADLELGRHAEAVGELEQLIAEHPLRERPRTQLMLALYRSGRQAEALQGFQDARTTLVEELGLEPSPALQALERQILNHDPGLLLATALPPVKNLSETNLPIPATPFLSREKEVGEVMDLLSREHVRLVTLTGPGGTGKTRLAVQAAGLVADAYPNGVWWVPLTPLRDPELVLPTAARALGAKKPLAEHIGDSRMLLLLDNFEQVVEAAPDLSGLVAACPNLRLLVTSRELIRIRGEVEYAVPTLAEPEAVELFCARSRLEPGEEIAELCRRLDNLPLAVELAAARAGLLSPAQILERLAQRLDLLTGGPRDADPRQRTLRATIEWSHDLLTGQERQLFARLSVFAGGCTLDAVEQVAHADLDTLQSLLEKSLIQRTGERYWMLQTIREYAAGQLDGETCLRHAEWFLAFAEEAESELMGARQAVWLARLDTEYDNLRAALAFLRRSGRSALELRLAGALWRFWYLRGFLNEGRSRLEEILAAARSHLAVQHEKILYGAAVLTHRLGDYDRAEELATERLAISRARGDSKLIASSLACLALMVDTKGEHERALALHAESVELARKEEDKLVLARALHNLGEFARIRGDAETARSHLEEAVALFREISDAHGTAVSLADLGEVARAQGQIKEAKALGHEALGLAHILRDKQVINWCLENLCEEAASEGQQVRAVRLLGASEALRESTGDVPDPSEQRQLERITELLGTELDEEHLAAARAEGHAMTLDEAVAYALKSAN